VGFLATWFLLLGGAAVVPLLIHLLRRRVGLEVEFPAARYLARAEREHSRTLKMRNLLLMMLRMLAIVLVALAAARPTARLGGSGHAPTALAIVLDNSMSTSLVEEGAPLLDRFKRMADDALASAAPDDRLYLVTVDGAVRGGSAASLRGELERVRLHAGAGNISDAVARALAAVQGSGLAAMQVAVLTDGQRSAWQQPVQARGNAPVLVYAPRGAPPANRAVVLAEARPARWTPRGAVATRILTADSTTYRMALGERTLARGTVTPGEEAAIRAAPAERGWTAGTIDIEPDELVADNTRHFALWIGPAPAVRVTASAGPFIRNAVDVLKASGRVVDGAAVSIGPPDEVNALPALLLAPSDPVRVGAANRALERLGVPWRFGTPRREQGIVRGDGLAAVSVASRYTLAARSATVTDTLARVGSDAWIVSGPGYVLVGSPLAPEATDLPVSAGFLPWVGDVLSARLHADPGGVRYAAPGERVARPAGVTALESGDGARTQLDAGVFEAPAAAGTYFFVQGSRRVGALVVNPEERESNLERWSARELRERVSSASTRVVSEPAEWTRLAFAGASQRSLVVPLLVLLLIVLLGEMLLSSTGGRGPA
jgi:hypothetical protein